jgi:hypothetical protein
MNLIIRDAEISAEMESTPGFRVLRSEQWENAPTPRNLFVLSTASQLPSLGRLLQQARRRHDLKLLCVRNDIGVELLPLQFQRARLHALSKTLFYQEPSLPHRVLQAWRLGATQTLIAHAVLLDGQLHVMNCALQSFKVDIDQIPALAHLKELEWKEFIIDPDGSFIHWPTPDIHVDLEMIRYACDPVWRMKQEHHRLLHHASFGEAIRVLRRANRLTQTSVKGISSRHLRRIENGEPATERVLHALADAHAFSTQEYLSHLADLIQRMKK